MNVRLRQLLGIGGRSLSRHSPAIMLGVGIGMAFAAIVTAVTATPKALEKIDEAKAETPKEKVKTAWKCYIPSAVLFLGSSILLIGGHRISVKRSAAIAAACSVTETALMHYKDAISENVAPEIKEKIEDAVVAKQIQKSDPRDMPIYISDTDGVLCYEPLSGRYFKSSKEKIIAAVNELNHDMLCDGFGGTASVNDLYDKIDLPNNDLGDVIGWNTSNGLLEIIFGSQLAPDGTPCLVMQYDKPPIHGFDRY